MKFCAIALAVAALAGCADARERRFRSVSRADLVIGVEITGTLRAVDSTPLKPPPVPDLWRFKVSHMAEEGIVVSVGDVVASFDTSELRQRLARKRNEAESAGTEIKRHRADAALRRQNETLAIGEREAKVRKLELKNSQPAELRNSLELKTAALDQKIAVIDLENARQRAELSRQSDSGKSRATRDRFKRLTAQIKEIEASIARMTLKAPRAGTLIYPMQWGSKVKVGDTVWVMRNVVEIVSLDEMLGRGTVDEVDSSKVALEQSIGLRVDSYPDTEVKAVVKEIGDSFHAKSRSDRSKVIDIELALTDTAELPLRPGMRFRGTVETERLQGVLVVAANAVIVTADGPVVHRRAGDDIEVVSVTIGARNAKEIEITAGLSEGDEIALPDDSEDEL